MSRIVISIYDDVRNPHYAGGGATVVRQIAEKLSEKHAVTVVSASFPGWREKRPTSFTQRYIRVGWAGPRAGQAFYHLLLPFYASQMKYDIWIESFTPPISTSFLPLVSRGRPVAALVQMLTASDSSIRYRIPFLWIERLGLRQYTDFLVLNDADRQVIEDAHPLAKCRQIKNGLHLPGSGKEFGGGEYVLFLGRIDVRQKGLDLLLDAHELSGTGMTLVVAGSGPRREERRLTQIIAEKECSVAFVGHVSGQAKHELLRNASFLVLSSRYETFGMSALEAMSHGKPVVHFDLPRLSWIPETAGRKVAPFQTSALAAAMAELAGDDEMRVAMGRAARRVAEGHAWESVGPSVVSEIERLIV